MDAFKKTVQARSAWTLLGLITLCSCMVLSRRFFEAAAESESLKQMTIGFQAGIFMALAGMLVFFGVRSALALRNSDRLRRLYIAETDERNVLIRQKTGSVGMIVCNYGLALGAVVAGNIDGTAFLTMLAACIFVTLVHAGLKLYYRRRF